MFFVLCLMPYLLSSQKFWFGIRDLKSGLPEKTHPGSRGKKKHRIQATLVARVGSTWGTCKVFLSPGSNLGSASRRRPSTYS
jgi:hypothetical protein